MYIPALSKSFKFFTLLILLVSLHSIKSLIKNDEKISPNDNRNHFNLNFFGNSTDAKCLDGSPYGVYYSPGYETGKNNILISFWGGGWCSGRDKNSFLSDCLERSNSSLGSSNFWDREVNMDGSFLGGDPNKNINFYNWHRFDFPYCDGSGHQGHVTDPLEVNNKKLFFRGHSNTLTGLNFVFEKVKFAEIDTIAITGCSAGGLATFYWTQYIADYVRIYNKNIKVFGFPDSGFFVDHIHLATQDNDYKLKQKVLFETVNQEVLPVSKDCLKENAAEPYNCLLAEKIFKYIDVPFLMLQPAYDTWQLINILGEECTKNNSLNQCDEKLKQFAHEYKNYQKKLIVEEQKNKKNLSVWSPSCVIHCFGQDQQNSADWQVPQSSGNTIDLIIQKYLNMKGNNQISLMDELDWPFNAKCANLSLKSKK